MTCCLVAARLTTEPVCSHPAPRLALLSTGTTALLGAPLYRWWWWWWWSLSTTTNTSPALLHISGDTNNNIRLHFTGKLHSLSLSSAGVRERSWQGKEIKLKPNSCRLSPLLSLHSSCHCQVCLLELPLLFFPVSERWISERKEENHNRPKFLNMQVNDS